jgi:hypothetical protein
MSKSTGVTLVAVGAILVLAVSVQLPGVNLKLTGLVLIVTGLAGLRAPRLLYGWLLRHRELLRWAMGPVEEPADGGPRVPIDDLLGPAGKPGPQVPPPERTEGALPAGRAAR